ncbi:O-antigen ligase family protein [Salinibacter ruber]|uniref:O-antigen ligase family protein n=1 Tax=Salinibacter ruber TaxID=146919 RepID=UPI00216A882A|nr:hypothetical protein [Salinibacter ruber]MCS4199752.1 hypothetical protein [Salinibacter ruber]
MKAWKVLLGLFFLLVVVDGALRKWVFPQYETILLLLKGGVLLIGYAAYAQERDPLALPRPVQHTWVPLLLVGYGFVVFLQAFNLNQPNFIVPAIGVKAHLNYVPLVVLLPALLVEVTKRKIRRFLWGYTLFLFVPVAVLCVYQFFQPPEAWINQYVREMQTRATVVGYPRVTGTFSYMGSLSPFLRLNALLGVAILLAWIQWREMSLGILGGILTVSSLIAVPMTGGRGLAVLIGAGVLGMLVIMPGRPSQRIGAVFVGAILAFGLAQGLQGSGLLEGWEALVQRTQQTGVEEAEGRIEGLLTAPFTSLDDAGLVGYGVGTNHQASPRFVQASDWAGRRSVDNPVMRLMMELGTLGWLVLTALKGALLYMAFRAVRASRRPIEFILAATAFSMMLPHLLLAVVFIPVTSALYWGAAGTVIGIWSLQRVRQSVAGAKVSQQQVKAPPVSSQ